MNPVTRKYMQLLGRIQINDRGNAGIVWSAAAPPSPHATGFIGNVNGNPTALALNTANANLTATEVSNAMLAHILTQGKVRRIRYILYLTGGPVQIDSTQVGYVNMPGVVGEMGDVSPLFTGGADVSLQTFTDYYEKLYARYVARYRNTSTTMTNTICHSSCHSSCYGSRSRR